MDFLNYILKKYAQISIIGICFLVSLPLTAQQSGLGQATDSSSIQIVLVPRVESTLSSQISAKIKDISVDEGEAFKINQHLITFDCEVLTAERRKAQAEHQGAQKKLQTNRRLNQLQSISKLEVDLAEAEYLAAKAELERIEEMIKYCIIKAPFNGRVVEKLVNPYESVPEGQPLIKILDDTSLKIELFVPSSWLSWLRVGTKFTVLIEETGDTYPAKVKTVGANIDAVSQSLKIIGELDGDFPELIAGMGGQATFNKEDKNEESNSSIE